MTAARLDLIVEKKARFYMEINLLDINNQPVSLVGREVKVAIKESTATDTLLHLLTEANGGVVVLDDANGKVGLFISSTDTNVDADYGVYTLIRIDPLYPDLDNERILEGKVTYTKGAI